jgi:hypothetical protein
VNITAAGLADRIDVNVRPLHRVNFLSSHTAAQPAILRSLIYRRSRSSQGRFSMFTGVRTKMPKRIVDGEGIWKSDKIAQVELPLYRAEFANLLQLALANGSFECNARAIWTTCYGYNRPDVTPEDVAAILDEFERVKLLFRWTVSGKTWGFWVGIDKPGRLPSEARLNATTERVKKFQKTNCANSSVKTRRKPLACHRTAQQEATSVREMVWVLVLVLG